MTLSAILYIGLVLNGITTSVLVCRANREHTLFTLLSIMTLAALAYFCGVYPLEIGEAHLLYLNGAG